MIRIALGLPLIFAFVIVGSIADLLGKP